MYIHESLCKHLRGEGRDVMWSGHAVFWASVTVQGDVHWSVSWAAPHPVPRDRTGVTWDSHLAHQGSPTSRDSHSPAATALSLETGVKTNIPGTPLHTLSGWRLMAELQRRPRCFWRGAASVQSGPGPLLPLLPLGDPAQPFSRAKKKDPKSLQIFWPSNSTLGTDVVSNPKAEKALAQKYPLLQNLEATSSSVLGEG